MPSPTTKLRHRSVPTSTTESPLARARRTRGCIELEVRTRVLFVLGILGFAALLAMVSGGSLHPTLEDPLTALDALLAPLLEKGMLKWDRKRERAASTKERRRCEGEAKSLVNVDVKRARLLQLERAERSALGRPAAWCATHACGLPKWDGTDAVAAKLIAACALHDGKKVVRVARQVADVNAAR